MAEYPCAKCKQECELVSSTYFTIMSPLMPGNDLKFALCFDCSSGFHEWINPKLLDDPEYIANRDKAVKNIREQLDASTAQ